MADWNELYDAFTISKINYNSDRIQPFVEYKMPDKRVYDKSQGKFVTEEGKWIEFALGIFLLNTPTKREINNKVYRDIEAYDGLVILDEDRFLDRYTIKAGTKYYDAMVQLLQSAGIKKYNIQYTGKWLKNDMEYEPGTEKGKALNDLAAAISYTPFWVDEYGYFTSSKYISPQEKSVDYEYVDDPEMSIVFNGMEEELDLYSVPNVWIGVYSNVDSTEGEDAFYYKSVLKNENVGSPTSTIARGRNIVRSIKVENIADQQSLDEYIERVAFEASQVFGKLKFDTAIMPFHAYSDVLHIRNQTLGIEGKYAETSWSINLAAGEKMRHEVRKVVDI